MNTGHGTKYSLDIEGVLYPWHDDEITVAQIRQLAGISGDQQIVEIDKADNTEVTLASDAVIALKPGQGFSKKHTFKRGSK